MDIIEEEPLRSIFTKLLDEYAKVRQEQPAGHPIASFIRKDIPRLFYSTKIRNLQDYLITTGAGQGNMPLITYICVLDKTITTSPQRGVYIVYLLSKDGDSLYLTLNQGCTEIKNSFNKNQKRETILALQKNVEEIRKNVNPRSFSHDGEIYLGDKLKDNGEYYQKGAIFFKEYKKGSVPPEEDLQADLSEMMQIYAEYAVFKGSYTEPIASDDDSLQDDGGESTLSVKDMISIIKDYIAAQGFSYEDDLIENFYLSLKSKPFVILAGTSGTGKTRLVRLFAEAVGATIENGRFKMIPVRPDWSDSTDLYGYKDLNGNFIPGAIIDFLKQAEDDINYPYFLCLDEMNLARVEYYLSDFLSVVETRGFEGERIVTDPMLSISYYGGDDAAIERYGEVRLPENLYIIGTVNMDETTFPFSKKVLDRANTIEFSYVDLMHITDVVTDVIQPLCLDNNFLKTPYLRLNHCYHDVDKVMECCSELKQINEILKKANAQVGYRVRDEIVFYLLNNSAADLLPENVAMDNVIIQKLLPRIQGSSSTIKKMLCDFFKHCAGDYEGYQTEDSDISAKMVSAAQRSECKYRKSAIKIAFMVGRYEEDGFTSYWL